MDKTSPEGWARYYGQQEGAKMAGCGGNCTCKMNKTVNDDPGSIGTPREPARLADALARVMVDNKVIARTVELYELGVVRVEDLVAQINAEKILGEF